MATLSYYLTDIPRTFSLRTFLLNVPVNACSVMSGRSLRFLGITSYFYGGKCILLNDIGILFADPQAILPAWFAFTKLEAAGVMYIMSK